MCVCMCVCVYFTGECSVCSANQLGLFTHCTAYTQVMTLSESQKQENLQIVKSFMRRDKYQISSLWSTSYPPWVHSEREFLDPSLENPEGGKNFRLMFSQETPPRLFWSDKLQNSFLLFYFRSNSNLTSGQTERGDVTMFLNHYDHNLCIYFLYTKEWKYTDPN